MIFLVACQKSGLDSIQDGTYGISLTIVDGNNQNVFPEFVYDKQLVVQAQDTLKKKPIEGIAVEFYEETKTGAIVLQPLVITDSDGKAATWVRSPKKSETGISIAARIKDTTVKRFFTLNNDSATSCSKLVAETTNGDVETAGELFGFRIECLDREDGLDVNYNKTLDLLYSFITNESWNGNTAKLNGNPLPETFNLSCTFVNGVCTTDLIFELADARATTNYWIGDGPTGLADVFNREITVLKNSEFSVGFANNFNGDTGIDGIPLTADDALAIPNLPLDYTGDSLGSSFHAVSTDKAGNFIRNLDPSEVTWGYSNVVITDLSVDTTLVDADVVPPTFTGTGNPKLFAPARTGSATLEASVAGIATGTRLVNVYPGAPVQIKTKHLPSPGLLEMQALAGVESQIEISIRDQKGNLISAQKDGLGAMSGSFPVSMWGLGADSDYPVSGGCANAIWRDEVPPLSLRTLFPRFYVLVNGNWELPFDVVGIQKSCVSRDGSMYPGDGAENDAGGMVNFINGRSISTAKIVFNDATNVEPVIHFKLHAYSGFPEVTHVMNPFEVNMGDAHHIMLYRDSSPTASSFVCNSKDRDVSASPKPVDDPTTPVDESNVLQYGCMIFNASDPIQHLYPKVVDKGGNIMPIQPTGGFLWQASGAQAGDIWAADSGGNKMTPQIGPSFRGLIEPRTSGSGYFEMTTDGYPGGEIYTRLGVATNLSVVTRWELTALDEANITNTISAHRTFRLKIVALDSSDNRVPYSKLMNFNFVSAGHSSSPIGTSPVVPNGLISVSLNAGQAIIDGFRLPNAMDDEDGNPVTIQIANDEIFNVASNTIIPSILTGPTVEIKLRNSPNNSGIEINPTGLPASPHTVSSGFQESFYLARYDIEGNFKGDAQLASWSGTIFNPFDVITASGPGSYYSNSFEYVRTSPAGTPYTLNLSYTEAGVGTFNKANHIKVIPGSLSRIRIRYLGGHECFSRTGYTPAVAGEELDVEIKLQDTNQNNIDFSGSKNVTLSVENNTTPNASLLTHTTVGFSSGIEQSLSFTDGVLTTPISVKYFNTGNLPRLRSSIDQYGDTCTTDVLADDFDHFVVRRVGDLPVEAGTPSTFWVSSNDQWGNITGAFSATPSIPFRFDITSALGGQDIVATSTLTSPSDVSGPSNLFVTGVLEAGEGFVDVVATQAGLMTADVSVNGGIPVTPNINPFVHHTRTVIPKNVIDHLEWAPAPASTEEASSTFSLFGVKAFDEYNNLLTAGTNSTPIIDLALNTGNIAYLLGTKSKTANAGLSQFDNISYSSAENIQLRASVNGNPGVPAITSNVNVELGSIRAIAVIFESTQTFTPGTGSRATSVSGIAPSQTADADFYVRFYAVDAGYNVVASHNEPFVPRIIHSVSGVNDDPNAVFTKDDGSPLPSGFAEFTNGYVRLKVKNRKAGTFKIRGPSAIGEFRSDAYTVNPASPSKLVVTLPGQSIVPGSTSLGQAIVNNSYSVPVATDFVATVTATDAFYNTITTDSATAVNLEQKDSSGAGHDPRFSKTPGTTKVLSNGTASFDIRYYKALSATHLTPVTANAAYTSLNNSYTFNVNAGAPTQVLAVLPGQTLVQGADSLANAVANAATAQVAGTLFNVTVYAVDAHFNIVTTHNGAITLTTSDAEDTNPAATNFIAGQKSISVTNVKASAGHFVSLSGSGLATHHDSSTYTVAHGVATQVIVKLPGQTFNPGKTSLAAALSGSPTPSSYTAGQSVTLDVHLTDAHFNVVTNANATLTVKGDGGAVDNAVQVSTTISSGQALGLSVPVRVAGATRRYSATVADAYNITGHSATFVLNHAAASQLAITAQPANPTTAGAVIPLTVTIRDAYANTVNTGADATASVAMTLFSGPAGGILESASNTKSAVGGVVSFAAPENLNIKKSHTSTNYILTATKADMSGSGGAGTLNVNTNGFLVRSSAATSFTLVAANANPVAGVAQNVTVTAFDTYSNIATGYTSTVVMTSTDAQATLPANYTFVSGDAGVKIFSVTLKTAATQTLRVEQNGSPGIFGQQTGILVTPAAHSKFLVNATATPVTAGTWIPSITVTASDAYNNTITSYADSVRVSADDTFSPHPDRTITKDIVFVGGDNGVKVMTNQLSLTHAGTRTITAHQISDGTKTGSTTVAIVAKPANKLDASITGNNQSAAVASTLPVAPRVRVLDNYGNAVSGYSVQFDISGGNGTIGGSSSHAVNSDANGYASAAWVLGTTPGTNNNTLTAGNLALAGTPKTHSFAASATAGALESFVLSGLSSPVTAGTIYSVSVTAKDAYSNTITDYSGTVSFSTNGADAPFPTSITFTVPDNGTKSADVMFRQSGTGRVLTATSSGKTGTHAAVVVNAAPAHHIEISSGNSQSVQAGTQAAAPIVAKIVDVFGNGIENHAIDFSVTAGGGSVSSASVNTDASGLASVNWTVGTGSGASNTLNASAAGLLSSPTSVNYSATVIAANPAKILFTTVPSTEAVQNQNFPQAAMVQLYDAYNNIAPSSGVNLSMAAFSDASCSVAASSLSNNTSNTNASGVASFATTRYTSTGSIYLKVTGAGLSDTFATNPGNGCAPMTVYAPLVITPSSITVAGGTTQIFDVTGGKAPYLFSLPVASSGNDAGISSVDADSEQYIAGTEACGVDQVHVVDDSSIANQSKTASITVNSVAKIQIWEIAYSNPDAWGTVGSPQSKTYYLQNTGCAATGTISVSLVDTNGGDLGFSKTADDCSASSLGASDYCSVEITFDPGSVSSGAYAADVLFQITSGLGSGQSVAQDISASKP